MNRRYDDDGLRHRRQFVLGPAFPQACSEWNRVALSHGWCLAAHPDLAVVQERCGNLTATLLGYILDPDHPEFGNADIVGSIAREVEAAGEWNAVFELTTRHGGRWALLLDDGAELRIFTDAMGHRRVFYTPGAAAGTAWLASQPGMIAEQLQLTPDPDAVEFIEACRAVNDEYRFPGDTSAFAGIRHLQPNHYLDLTNMQCRRFWPAHALRALSADEAIGRAAALLQGLMRSAAHRGGLGLRMTAGLDTRMLLAAAHGVREDLYLFSMIWADVTPDSTDVALPARLLSHLGLEQHMVRCPDRMDAAFAQTYEDNVAFARCRYGAIVQGLFDSVPHDRILVEGSANAITRGLCRASRRLRDPGAVTGRELASVAGMGDLKFAVAAFERWLQDATPLYNVDVMDLFCWENREGDRQTLNRPECDISHEVLVPFNCRAYLTALLGVEAHLRREPEDVLHRRIIEHMWADVLHEPIHPDPDTASDAMAHTVGRKSLVSTVARVARLLRAHDADDGDRDRPVLGDIPALVRATWIVSWMRLAGVPGLGRAATWLAARGAPAYTARRFMARINARGYIDPAAVVQHGALCMGHNVFIDERVVLSREQGGGSLELADRVAIMRDCIVATGSGGTISIGSRTTIQPRCQIMGYVSHIRIGRNVQIAPNSAFYSYDHGIEPGVPIWDQPLSSKGGIDIGDDAWIGFGAIVLDGVRIGRGAVIGAGAVVTQDVPDGAIAVGVPARVVRMRGSSAIPDKKAG